MSFYRLEAVSKKQALLYKFFKLYSKSTTFTKYIQQNSFQYKSYQSKWSIVVTVDLYSLIAATSACQIVHQPLEIQKANCTF